MVKAGVFRVEKIRKEGHRVLIHVTLNKINAQ